MIMNLIGHPAMEYPLFIYQHQCHLYECCEYQIDQLAICHASFYLVDVVVDPAEH